jgi:hypothetical protein
MSTETKRTPGPWEVEERDGDVFVEEVVANDDESQWIVAKCHGPMAEANAAYIVRACNAYAGHVAACEEIVRVLDAVGWRNVASDWPVVTDACKLARAALQRAGE